MADGSRFGRVEYTEEGPERRSRTAFTVIIVGFVVLAMGGGILAAWAFIIGEDKPDDLPIVERNRPPPTPSVEPPPVFEPPPEPPPETPTKVVKTVRTGKAALSDADIRKGFDAIADAVRECGRKHGALAGTRIKISFTIAGPQGRVSRAAAVKPHTITPLGKCIAAVVKAKARFPKTKERVRTGSYKFTM